MRGHEAMRRSRGRWYAWAHRRSTLNADEDDQRTQAQTHETYPQRHIHHPPVQSDDPDDTKKRDNTESSSVRAASPVTRATKRL